VATMVATLEASAILGQSTIHILRDYICYAISFFHHLFCLSIAYLAIHLHGTTQILISKRRRMPNKGSEMALMVN